MKILTLQCVKPGFQTYKSNLTAHEVRRRNEKAPLAFSLAGLKWMGRKLSYETAYAGCEVVQSDISYG